ncbi:hypothetical protein [Bartonella tribocorum]|uniref:hypothetical protein n=1 Tax=Bartonella tribocorum TaxID=85701 RepID=UPI0013052D7A|nr:hypothetical protein [Bartonella tribocorum]
MRCWKGWREGMGRLLVSFYEMMLFEAWGDEKILMRKDASCWQYPDGRIAFYI